MLSSSELGGFLYEMLNYISKHQSYAEYSSWCVGITSDPVKKELQLRNKINIIDFKSWNLSDQKSAMVMKRYLFDKGIKKSATVCLFSIDLIVLFKSCPFLYIYHKK